MFEADQTSEDKVTKDSGVTGPEYAGDATVDVKDNQAEKDTEKLTSEEGKKEEKEEDVEMEDIKNMKGEDDNKESGKQDGKGEKVEESKVVKGEEKVEEEKEVEGGQEQEKMEEEAEEVDLQGNEAEDTKEQKGTKKKRSGGRRARVKGETDEKNERKRSEEVVRTPVIFSTDRPVRERKTVVRLVETIEKEQGEGFLIVKGRGTPLKDIPNVAYKLSKRKPDDIKLLHLILFGRKGKAIDFKSHISEFSGFVWHENEEKQRANLKEKLDKCIKDKLLDFCDVFDIPVSRATARKEDLVVKLLDFMVTPHATTDVLHSEKKQELTGSVKRKRRGSMSGSVGSSKRSRKRTDGYTQDSKEKNTVKTDGGDEDEEDQEKIENGVSDREHGVKQAENEKENESEEHEHEKDEDLQNVEADDKKSERREQYTGTSKSKKRATQKKTVTPISTTRPGKTSASECSKDEAKNDLSEKVFSRKKTVDKAPKQVMSPNKAKVTGRKFGGGKTKSEERDDSGPTKAELRKMICKILKEVDFNKATFTDILKQLVSNFKTDLAPRKAEIKLMVKEELTKLAEEEDKDDREDEGGEKNMDTQPAIKDVEA